VCLDRVHSVASAPLDDSVPPFARSTAAHAIRETLRDPGVEAISDLATKEVKVRVVRLQWACVPVWEIVHACVYVVSTRVGNSACMRVCGQYACGSVYMPEWFGDRFAIACSCCLLVTACRCERLCHPTSFPLRRISFVTQVRPSCVCALMLLVV